MSDFQGTQRIRIQPNTVNYPIRFTFPVATAAGGSGAIPYGNSIVSAVVKAYDPQGTDVSSSMVSDVVVTYPNMVNCALSYFPGALEGFYKLTIILTLSQGGYVEEFDAKRRVWVGNM